MTKSISLILCLMALAWPGCATRTTVGGTTDLRSPNALIVMVPFRNSTEDENAGRAVTQMTGSAMLQRNLPVKFAEEGSPINEPVSPETEEQSWRTWAQGKPTTHLLFGEVFEYRYKTDLDGAPAVSVGLKLVSVETGETVWQANCSKVGHSFSSVSLVAQKVVDRVLDRFPKTNKLVHGPARDGENTSAAAQKTK